MKVPKYRWTEQTPSVPQAVTTVYLVSYSEIHYLSYVGRSMYHLVKASPDLPSPNVCHMKRARI